MHSRLNSLRELLRPRGLYLKVRLYISHASQTPRGTATAAVVAALLISGANAVHAQNVTLTDNGSTVVLANGLVTATVQKSDAKITRFMVGSSPNLAGSKGFYYTTHVVSGSTDNFTSLSAAPGAVYSVVVNTPEMVDISIRNPKLGYDATLFPNGMFDVDKHFVMRSGVSGIYTYVIWHHNADQPKASLYQQRTSESQTNLSGTVYAYSDANVWNVAPDAATFASAKVITDSTYELPSSTTYTHPTGMNYQPGWPIYSTPNPMEMIGLNYNLNPVWTKYDWAVYSGPETSSLNAFGVANDQYGVWMLNGSQEYLNGGPTKLRGAVQAGSMNINTNEDHGIGDAPEQPVDAGVVWQKIFGPYLIYANAGTDHNQLWQDARAKGAQEVSAWPYNWLAVDEELYPRNRGAITGTLNIPGQSAANAQIIVADAGLDWIFQGALNYIYSTRADANGRFTVPKLRPHTYSLYAYVPGVLGDFHLDGVTVTANTTADLGAVTWDPPQRKQRIFRVGTPDRSTGEFRFGNLPRQFGLWWRYYDERGSADLNYNVGTSSPASDWYYAQPVIAGPGGTYVAPRWNINFNLDAIPPAPAQLTIALAGASGSGAFHAYVNGVDVSTDTYRGIYTIDDTAFYRDGVKTGQYQVYPLQFNPSLLRIGSNTVSITVRKTGSGTWSGSRPVLPAYGIMYDCVQLEAGPQVSNILLSEGKPALASSSQSPSNDASAANDGDLSSRWIASSSGYPQSWRVDLGAAHTLRGAVIRWYAASARFYKYKIELSNDDINYVTAVDKTNNIQTGDSYDTLPSTAEYRYLRVTVTGSGAGTGSSNSLASFYECQVFGD